MISKPRKLILLFVLMIILSMVGQSLVFAAEGAARKPWEIWNYDKEKPVRGGTYVIASTTEVGLFNPNHWPVMDWISILFFYDPPFIADGAKRSRPFTVESFEYTDQLTFVMKFKQGIRFHDGADYDALAFKIQMEYIKDKANGCWGRGMLKPIESIEILDKHTVKLKFNKPWSSFIGAMQDPPGWLISPKALEGDVLARQVKKLKKKVDKARKKADKAAKKANKGDAAADKKAAELADKASALAEKLKLSEEKTEGLVSTDHKPVGTGKWIFDEYRSGNILRVKRNPDWWYGKSVGHPDMPYFNARATVVIPDISIQLANLRAGKIHEMNGLDKSLYEKAKKNKALSVTSRPSLLTYALRINHNNKVLKDVRVRKAINLAIDRKALVQGIFFGLATPATSFMPHDHWARNKTLTAWEYNPEKAKALLAEAGYKDGLTLNQGVILDYLGQPAMAEPLKAMLANVGIKWETQTLSMAAASDRSTNLEYDLYTDGWGISDPQTYLSRIYHPNGPSNSGRINHKKLTSMLDAASIEMDEEKRKQIYLAIDKLLYDEVIDIYLVYDYAITAMRSNVRGYDSEMAAKWDFLYIFTHPFWFKDGKP